jgi:hypothetical protein
MKANPSARYLVTIRVIMTCVALAAIAGLECYVGASMAARINQTAAYRTEGGAAPSMNLSELMAAAR